MDNVKNDVLWRSGTVTPLGGTLLPTFVRPGMLFARRGWNCSILVTNLIYWCGFAYSATSALAQISKGLLVVYMRPNCSLSLPHISRSRGKSYKSSAGTMWRNMAFLNS